MRSRYAAAVILADGEGVNSCMNPAAALEKKEEVRCVIGGIS